MNYNLQSPVGSVELDHKIGIYMLLLWLTLNSSTIQVLLTGGELWMQGGLRNKADPSLYVEVHEEDHATGNEQANLTAFIIP